jgi:predicted ATPase
MMNRINIELFKCFKRLTLPLAPLTLLTGFNAGGKSTTIQALLLLAEMLRSNPEGRHVGLNGPLTQLGTAREVVHGEHRVLGLGSGNSDAEIGWFLSAEDRRSTVLDIMHIEVEDAAGPRTIQPGGAWWEGLSPAAKDLVRSIRETIFISAVRLELSPTFPSPNTVSPIHADVGPCGQFAPWWFARCSDEPVPLERRLPGVESDTLRSQVSAWAGTLFPGAEADAAFVDLTDLVRLSLRRSITEEWRRPANIGYGLTYAFPILVAGLLAKPGQILVIDSPEAHLHPRAQSGIAKFLAAMVKAGVQVLLESHSDHVLNGVRLAVKNGPLSPDEVAVHFFTGGEDNAPPVISARIDKDGGVSDWPKGFFDQAENDLAALAGWH